MPVAEAGPLVGLGRRLIGDPEIDRIVGVDGATLAVAAAAQAIVLAGLVEATTEGTLLVVTATQSDAERLHADLVCFLGAGVEAEAPGSVDGAALLLPAWDTLPLERVSPEIASMGQRLAVRWRLAGDRPPAVVVAPVRALLQRVAPDPLGPLTVRPGDRVDIDELIAGLVARGYRREHQVEHRGEVAVRGGIIDVFGATASGPVRIDLFGDEVDRLTAFDVADQRSSDAVGSAWFFGCREMVVSEEMAERAKQLADAEPWTASVLDRIVEGEFFDGMEGWLGPLAGAEELLTDGLGAEDTVVLVEPRRATEPSSSATRKRRLSLPWSRPGPAMPMRSSATISRCTSGSTGCWPTAVRRPSSCRPSPSHPPRHRWRPEGSSRSPATPDASPVWSQGWPKRG